MVGNIWAKNQSGPRIVCPLQHPLTGTLAVPGDKSLSHRALLLAAMARTPSRLSGLLDSWDVRSTYSIIQQLGAKFSGPWNNLSVQGWENKRCPGPLPLDCGNSGTSMRLLAGALAGGNGCYTLTGDSSLNARPMRRIVEPLCFMGADISCTADYTAPLLLNSRSCLRAIQWELPMASAQVKSCLLLAGTQAEGMTVISAGAGCRDHTERLLSSLGVGVHSHSGTVQVEGPAQWDGFRMNIAGDLSAAAYPVGIAATVPGSRITVSGVNLNPTRLGFYRILRRMGAAVTWKVRGVEMGEPWGDLQAEYNGLRGTVIEPEEIPGCVDELILLAVMAASAQGTTELRGAEELRCKESDRLSSTVRELLRLGVDIRERKDGWTVHGPTRWQSGQVCTHGDHRLEMSLAAAALAASPARETIIEDARWSAISWPSFWGDLMQWCS
ncbi:MAG: 3-phosphoshikimate 1-carboxyvinyltransferase [bacterium]|nr:3-phosphoshikimate 1-carboxyvinyltransferase [bacterium]